jgi:Flp pilus assembly protein TadD
VAGYAESPGAALARNVRLLAANPRNYEALLGAGKAALETGDAEAAIGFYGRAEDVNPRSWVPKIGQGAALVQIGDPQAALRAFDEAQRLGASHSAIALDRGLAFDLIGDQVKAQADYQVALSGVDRDEARRRLALSLAISGNRLEALTTLDPLLARRDMGAIRCRAFVLALTGDVEGARLAVNGAMPGHAATMDPFLRRLVSLNSSDKAAAVHLGVMPGGAGHSISTVTYMGPTPVPGAGESRLADIDRILAPSPAPAAPPVQQQVQAPPAATPVRVASARPRAQAEAPARSRHWVQLASSSDASRLPDQFRRLTSRHRDIFEGLPGYVAQDRDKARLLIGPFKDASDAKVFADDLASVQIDAFQWTSAPGQSVSKLTSQ